MIKLFASDLDGSFLNIHHQMDENQTDCLKRIRDNGCMFAIATGRGKNGLTGIPELYDSGVYTVMLNGAVIQDPLHNIIYRRPVDKGFIEHLYKELPQFPFEYCTEDLIYTAVSETAWTERRMRFSQGWMMRRKGDFERFKKSFCFDTSLQTLLEHDVFKINLHEPDPKKRKIIHNYLENHKDKVINAPSNPVYIEITDQKVDKAFGVRMLGEILGLDDDSIAVFGDGGNDISMLKAFRNSYAPADGDPDAIEAANFMTDSCENYGVVKTINEIIKKAK